MNWHEHYKKHGKWLRKTTPSPVPPQGNPVDVLWRTLLACYNLVEPDRPRHCVHVCCIDRSRPESRAYHAGLVEGHRDGYTVGYAEGHEDGEDDGYTKGKVDGYKDGRSYGYDDGKVDGYDDGYRDGLAEGADS